MHYKEHHFASRPITKYWRAADVSFSPSTVREFLFRPSTSIQLPQLRTALSTTLPLPDLNLSLTPGSDAQYSSSSRASSSHLTSPAPFGYPSRLTEVANAAAALRQQPEQAAHFQFPAISAALSLKKQPPGKPATATGPCVRPRSRSGPLGAAVSTVQPHVQPAATLALSPICPRAFSLTQLQVPHRHHLLNSNLQYCRLR